MTDTAFSRREREVLELILQGVDRPTIAAALHLSRHTVAHHVQTLMHAHGAPTVTVLVAKVLGARLARCEAEKAAIEQRRGERRAD